MSKAMKTDHNGAKNGGGYWGPRAEAKSHSKKRQRNQEKKEIRTLLRRIHNKG